MTTLPNKINFNLDGETEISVKGMIAPIEYSGSNFHVNWDTLANLRVAEPEKQYSASIFCDFLPKEAVFVGVPWEIEHAGALELLKQLHPNPSLRMCGELPYCKTESQGLWACLRAYNAEFADVVFRIHAQFALKDGWFTPSEFIGHLVLDRTKRAVAFFQMYVPEGTINFGAKWKIDPDEEGHITDSGFCPQIELRAGIEDIVRNTEFVESITQAEAEHQLTLCFYKSQHINWVSLEEALEMAPAQQKPIHAISIDGPLLDESC
ncbi:hypothetical protein F4054_10640 [Candidatus Poribacteria bacterium]|nr:hypothetical protein [Candidatus Poribacteria bacterium]MYG05262.1 hypothetical protein [Candidatus Poribacteria bacterium]MYK22703.1 hypothetical protein [Candidatus Poribacteria bacterium]